MDKIEWAEAKDNMLYITKEPEGDGKKFSKIKVFLDKGFARANYLFIVSNFYLLCLDKPVKCEFGYEYECIIMTNNPESVFQFTGKIGDAISWFDRSPVINSNRNLSGIIIAANTDRSG